MRKELEFRKDYKEARLPKGKENNEFNAKELAKRSETVKLIFKSHIEKYQTI